MEGFKVMYEDKIVLTGVKPTGTPHLGNMVGAIKPVIEMSHQAKNSYVFIADLHALNVVRDSKAIKQNTYEIAATFLALGLDTTKTALFRQSDIAEVFALSNFLMNVTPKGLMNRVHAYKASADAVRKQLTEAGIAIDDTANGTIWRRT